MTRAVPEKLFINRDQNTLRKFNSCYSYANKKCMAVPVVVQKSYLPKNWLNLLVTLKPFKLSLFNLML